jgi:hypothetical protein
VIESGRLGPVSIKYVDEAAEIRIRQAERDEFLECPPGYSAEGDRKRRAELADKKWKGQLTMAEETELADVVTRIRASKASFNRTPEGRRGARSEEVDAISGNGKAARVDPR